MRKAVRLVALAVVALSTLPRDTVGQEAYQVVRAFAETPINAVDALESFDGRIYVAATRGGAYDRGAIIALTRNAGGLMSVVTLHHFSGPDGSYPAAGLTEAGGVFYGTTVAGGAHGFGTIFTITGDGTFTLLHSFDNTDGSSPRSRLVLATDGRLYGTTDRSIFRMTLSGDVTVLVVCDLANGLYPGQLIQATNGHFYGTTDDGGRASDGTPGAGTVFRMTLDGVHTVLHTFPRADHHRPADWLVQASDGNLYGHTTESGPFNDGPGALFRVGLDGALTIVRVLDNPGESLDHVIVGNDGILYAASNGRVCRLSLNGDCTTIRTFAPIVGTGAYAVFAQTQDGRLFGGTGRQGPSDRGSLFMMTPSGTLTDWYGFVDPEPLYPTGPLLRGPDDGFYGTSCRGGLFNLGAVYHVTPAGTVTTIHSFAALDGLCPVSGLTRGNDGLLYGVSRIGGWFGFGTIFRVGLTGGLQVLHTFTGADGAYPNRLVQASDGSFYGTTERGGVSTEGTIFRMTPTGSLTVLHSSTGAGLMGRFRSGLMQASDGSLYGSSCFDGGVAFRMTLTGMLTVFPRPSFEPCSASEMMQAADGHLYGTSIFSPSRGGVYRVTLGGDISIVHEFALDGHQGARPLGTLVQSADGALYGSAVGFHQQLGPSPPAVLFKVTPEGAFTLVHQYEFETWPLGGLATAADGSLYGTISNKGQGERGAIFRLSLGAISDAARR